MNAQHILVTGAAAALFASMFVFGGRVQVLRDRRNELSFGGGMAAAYVFVHMMPELHGARKAFAESASAPLRYEGMAIYYVALLGFLAFYGLEHLRALARSREKDGTGTEGRSFRLHVGGFSAYVGLMAYLLVHNLEDTPTSVAIYAAAITVHFLSVDHSLREEHGERYDRSGRLVLAAMAVIGWGAGLVTELPRGVLAMVVAFISGAVIMNSTVMELPRAKEGRFIPFLAGGLVYGLALIPLG